MRVDVHAAVSVHVRGYARAAEGTIQYGLYVIPNVCLQPSSALRPANLCAPLCVVQVRSPSSRNGSHLSPPYLGCLVERSEVCNCSTPLS